jgi:LacI family transcriptional regulator
MAKNRKNKLRLPTMNDVAKLAGVSQTSVSFVVNNTPNAGIPEETKQRILAAIHELGYRPNAFAKSLRLRRSHIIGFVTDEIATSSYAGKIIQGAQDAAAAAGKILFLANTGGDPKLENTAIETMLEHQVDGIIYATMSHHLITPPEVLHEISSVLLDCYDENRCFPSVVPDEVSGASTALRVLLEKGHRRIGFINTIDFGPPAKGRLDGYKRALTEYDVPFVEELVCCGKSNSDSGYEQTLHLMQRDSPPTAIFCFNDQIAMGVYEALRELGLEIPHDVAVIGFDNLELISAFLRPKLSTMELPHYQMGQWAVNYLAEHAENKDKLEPVQHMIECPYIERASV